MDLRFFSEQGIMANAGKSLEFTAFIWDVLFRVEEVELPTVAVVDGFALAGGLEVALACDIVVCSDECRIGDQHSNYDLMPGAGGTQHLPRRVGRLRALELLYPGRHLGGREAVAIGLALELDTADHLDAALEDLLGRLRGKSRHGLAAIRQAVRRGLEIPIRDGLDMEPLVTQEYFSRYPDALSGSSTFMTRPRAGSD